MTHLKNEKDFDNLVKKDLVIVDFYATWCGPCQLLGPVLESLDKERADLNILKVDVDEHESLARSHKIFQVPTLEIYKDGKLYKTILGYKTKEELEDLLK